MKDVLAVVVLLGVGVVLLMVGIVAFARMIPALVIFGAAGAIGFWVVKAISDARYGEGAWRFIVGLSNDVNGETERWRNKIGENAKFWGLVGVVVFCLLQWGLWELLEATLDDAALRFFEMGKYERVEE